MSQKLHNASNDEFVDNLYRKLLSREPDPEGRAEILGMLHKGAQRLDILDMFFRSEEFDGIRQAIAFARPGHFYSPHSGRREIDAHNQFDWDRGPLPGIDYREPEQLALLEAMAQHYPALPFADKSTPKARYGYDNPSYSYADGVMLFTMIQHLKPRRIIEVGSGHSSCAKPLPRSGSRAWDNILRSRRAWQSTTIAMRANSCKIIPILQSTRQDRRHHHEHKQRWVSLAQETHFIHASFV